MPRFLMIMHPNAETAYSTATPPVDAVERMTAFNQALVDSGALLSGDGLHGPDKGARVRYRDGRATVTDGPFAEAREVIGGYWMIRAASKEEAVAWACRVPGADGDMVEVRQVFDMDDFPQDVQDAAQLKT